MKIKKGSLKDFKKFKFTPVELANKMYSLIVCGNAEIYLKKRFGRFHGYIFLYKNVEGCIYADGESNCYISDLFVFPSKRKLGLGGELLEYVQENAKNMGFKKLYLAVECEHEYNKAFYLKRGFSNTQTILDYEPALNKPVDKPLYIFEKNI